MELSPAQQAKLEAAIAQDTQIFEELKEKIGLAPAAIISEIATLIVFASHGIAPVGATADNLLHQTLTALNLDASVVTPYIQRWVSIRQVKLK